MCCSTRDRASESSSGSDDDPHEMLVYPRYAIDGAANLAEARHLLGQEHAHYRTLALGGWELEGAVADGVAWLSAAQPPQQQQVFADGFEHDDGRIVDDPGDHSDDCEDPDCDCHRGLPPMRTRLWRVKYMFEGAASLASLGELLRLLAADLLAYERSGWRLREPVGDGWLHMTAPASRELN